MADRLVDARNESRESEASQSSTFYCDYVSPISFPGYSLYFEKVPWSRLVTCLSMPTQAAPRVGPQLNFVTTTL